MYHTGRRRLTGPRWRRRVSLDINVSTNTSTLEGATTPRFVTRVSGFTGGASSPEPSEEQDHEDPVELQIKCGRCQAITPTFADMKMHLLYVHGEEVHIRPHDEHPRQGGREVENELVKHTAHYWRQLNEKHNLVKCGSCDEEFFSFSKLKRHITSQHPGRAGGSRSSSPGSSGGVGLLAAGGVFNCVLCSDVLDSKELVMEHWGSHHHCEQPGLLWDALSSYPGQEEDGEADGDLDTPAPSPL